MSEDYRKIDDLEGVLTNEKLDEQTLLLEFIRTSIELNEQILAELKINNKHLSIITGDEILESDIDN